MINLQYAYVTYNNGDFQVTYKEPKMKYVEKEIGQLKPGDVFRHQSSRDFVETDFRVVDREDYKKVFGKDYPYGTPTNIVAYCISENRFTHFGSKDRVKVERPKVRLGSINYNSDFEFEDGIYYLDDFDGSVCECIRIDKKVGLTRKRNLTCDTMVYKLD